MSSLQLGSDTLVSTPSAGQQEFNGTIFTAAPTATTRGIVPTEQFYALNSGLSGANATGAQSVFGVGVTLAGSTQYEFEIEIILLKSAGTTSHTVALGFGGTATLNNILYQVIISNSTTIGVGNSASNIPINVATSTVLTGAITSASQYVSFVAKGTISINAGGTFIPQYTLSSAPGGAYTTQAGSYMKIKPLSASGANVSVGTWS